MSDWVDERRRRPLELEAPEARQTPPAADRERLGVLALVREARSMMASGVPRHDVVGGSRRPGREDRRYGENSALHDSGAVGAGGALLEGKGRTPNRGERRRSGPEAPAPPPASGPASRPSSRRASAPAPPRPGSPAAPGGRPASRRAPGSPRGAVRHGPWMRPDVGRHVERRDRPQREAPRSAPRQEPPRRDSGRVKTRRSVAIRTNASSVIRASRTGRPEDNSATATAARARDGGSRVVGVEQHVCVDRRTAPSRSSIEQSAGDILIQE